MEKFYAPKKLTIWRTSTIPSRNLKKKAKEHVETENVDFPWGRPRAGRGPKNLKR